MHLCCWHQLTPLSFQRPPEREDWCSGHYTVSFLLVSWTPIALQHYCARFVTWAFIEKARKADVIFVINPYRGYLDIIAGGGEEGYSTEITKLLNLSHVNINKCWVKLSLIILYTSVCFFSNNYMQFWKQPKVCILKEPIPVGWS